MKTGQIRLQRLNVVKYAENEEQARALEAAGYRRTGPPEAPSGDSGPIRQQAKRAPARGQKAGKRDRDEG